MYQETRRKRRNISHVEPRHPTRKLTSVVAGGTNGDTTKDLVLVAAILSDSHCVKSVERSTSHERYDNVSLTPICQRFCG